MRMRRRWSIWWGIGLVVAVGAVITAGRWCPRPSAEARPLGEVWTQEGGERWGWERPKGLPRYGFLQPDARLSWAYAAGRFPLIRGVFLQAGGRLDRVRSWRDLVGHVRIGSPREALGYVQFLTSYGVLARESAWKWSEVTAAPPGDTRADSMDDSWRPGRPHRRLRGVLHKDEWEANGLSEPAAEQVDGDFVVRRWLWTLDPKMGGISEGSALKTDVVWQVAHTITPDGRVSEKVLQQRELSGVRIVMPRLR